MKLQGIRGLVRKVSLMAGLSIASSIAMAQVQGVTADEIVVGSLTDLSGPVAAVGAPQRDGMILAVEEINAAGGIHGRKIRLVVEDMAYDPRRATLAAQKLAQQEKVFATIGTLGSAAHLASANILTQRNIPMLFPMVGTTQSYLPHSDLKFGLLPLAPDHTRAAVKWAHDTLGKRRFGLLFQDDETGHVGRRATEEQLKAMGLTLVESASYKRGDVNFGSQVARLRAANADFLILAAPPREVAAVAIEAKSQGWNVDMICTTGAVAPVITLGGQAAEGVYGMAGPLGQAQEMTPELKAVHDRFKARFGRDVVDGVNYGYWSMMLFAEGARNAGKDLTPQTMARGLEQVKNFTVAFAAPPVTYTATNHAPPPEAYVLQVKGGKWVKVAGPVGF